MSPHLVALVAFLAFIVLCWLGMLAGWRRRGRRQADLPALPPAPAGLTARDELDGVLLGTTAAGDWLDRTVAHGLGERCEARLTLTDNGVVVDRPGAAFLIPAASLRAVRVDDAHAGKWVGAGRVLVLTWEHGGRLLDTGVRAEPAATDRWHRLLDRQPEEEPTR